jgi:hypothetical protein
LLEQPFEALAGVRHAGSGLAVLLPATATTPLPGNEPEKGPTLVDDILQPLHLRVSRATLV